MKTRAHVETITISSTVEYLLLSVNSTCGQVNFGRPLSVPEDTELRQLYFAGYTYRLCPVVPFVSYITHCVSNCGCRENRRRGLWKFNIKGSFHLKQ